MAVKKSTDLGAALSGLILGGSVIFLVVLLVVWLTNSSFANREGHGAAPAHAAPASVSGAPPGTAATATPGAVPAH